MKNQPSSISNSQPLIETSPNTPGAQIAPAMAHPAGVTYPVLSPEVSQVPFIAAHLLDTRRGAATRGFIMGLTGLAALFLYVASFIAIFIPPLRLLRSFTGPTICGSLVVAIVSPILGIIFSIRGLKSTTRKGMAISGLILSLIPLLLVIALFALAFMVAWSNDTYPY